jgi:uncharacterized membrane protein
MTTALAVVALFGFAVEAVGVRTGFPFGEYTYTGVPRPQLTVALVGLGLSAAALLPVRIKP